MQDETITTEAGEQSSSEKAQSKVGHYFVEIGGDLLAKPSALCDLIEAEGAGATAVFCNTPSDADFIEVLLKKRGVKVRKLIGHISPGKLATTIDQVKNDEISVLVVTDVAAQGLKLKDFGLCIIHATHSDPEVYLERTGQTGDGEGGPAKVVSLVGPLDITHFHYLKKIVGIPIEKIELPDAMQISGARIHRIRQDAAKRNALQNEKIAALVGPIVEDPDRDQIIAYLLQNTLEVIPALTPASESRESGEDFRGGRGGRGDRDRGDRDRGDRDRGERDSRDRGDRDRGDRDRGDRDRGDRDRGDRDRGDRDRGDRDRGDRDRNRGGRRSEGRRWQDRDEGDEGQSQRGEGRREHRMSPPPKRELRLYIGQGTAHGFSRDRFLELLEKNSNTPREEIKRFSERKFYCFADMSEDFADSTVESLNGISLDDGETLFIKKAIQIPVPREDGIPRDSGDEDLEMMPPVSEDAREEEQDQGPEEDA